MAGRALALAKEDGLPPQLGGRRLLGIELSEYVQLRRRRKVEDLLELGHEVDLAAALEDVDALLGGNHRIPVEIGRPLLELREVLHGLQGTLGPEQPLDVDPAKRRRLDAMAELLRADVAHQMGSPVRVAVLVAVEAGHAEARVLAPPIRRGIELLLGNGVSKRRRPSSCLGFRIPLKRA